jgi:hypothetical protein
MIRNSIFYLALLFSLLMESCQLNKAFNCSNCSTSDKRIVRKIKKMNFEKYRDKEVNVFFHDLKYSYKKYIPISRKAGYIHRIMFVYSDSITIEIRVSNLKQDEPLNFGYTLDINEYKTKKIEMICFKYAGRCIKGCRDQICHDGYESN